MIMEKKQESLCDRLKAPEGKFNVCKWDPSNPEKSVPTVISGPYSQENFAVGYAKRRNADYQRRIAQAAAQGKELIGEEDYFVTNDRGIRIY